MENTIFIKNITYYFFILYVIVIMGLITPKFGIFRTNWFCHQLSYVALMLNNNWWNHSLMDLNKSSEFIGQNEYYDIV